ncbi:MAG: hypothetical protein ACOCYG_09245 [Spirochaetota bacterium]
MEDDLEFKLHGREIIGLYLLLTEHEGSLDAVLRRARERLEDELYSALSIEEMERIEALYEDTRS